MATSGVAPTPAETRTSGASPLSRRREGSRKKSPCGCDTSTSSPTRYSSCSRFETSPGTDGPSPTLPPSPPLSPSAAAASRLTLMR
ncbi:hypothetical protein Cob_v002498 [Colletotrichum orbiculare MAFF 240422]|uniref:Uncharacterized protein n=1 Tax=Colletotrichum orbiculare (strain 104-T / ATCC 96160 / CBS 514.97 / LARS 414 / MAFF 240422) TaxID=1213857 RepID=A0A484G432_COLOR|nr:hypothetical protein Cob_v002498 [Colletotrichum orbiculare MAFF 240422]